MAQKVRFWVQYSPFWDFGAQNRFLGPKMGPWGPLRKTLQKHKRLGRFLEAQGRETPILEGKRAKIHLRTGILVKKLFWNVKVGISAKWIKPPKVLPFLL